MDSFFSAYFAGNEPLLSELALLLDSGRMPHAIAIEGAHGCGKTALARLTAAALLCRCEPRLSMGCEHCVKVLKDLHPDCELVQGSGKTGAIPVDAVRRVRAQAQIAPNEADGRVFIFDSCDNMLPEAQNALLKVLEEPPAGVYFILLCLSRMSLLETIRSRARIFTLRAPTIEQAGEYLARLRPELPAEELTRAVNESGGCIGTALDILEGASRAERECAEQLALALCSQREQDMLSVCAAMKKDRAFIAGVLEELRSIARLAVILSVGGAKHEPPRECAEKLAHTISSERLPRILEELDALERALLSNIDFRTLLPTALCSKLRRAVGR